MSWRYSYPHALAVIGGRAYKWSGWFGCQLESWEWRRVPAGTERDLDLTFKTYRVRVFTTRRFGWRHWFKVRTTWTIPLRGSIDDQNTQLREFQGELRKLL